MELSQEVLIDFGLNLAGYIVVVLLAYVLFRMPQRSRKFKTKPLKTIREEIVRTEPSSVRAEKPVLPQSDYIALSGMQSSAPAQSQRSSQPDVVYNRRKNRREIYEQARKLLSKGKSSAELLEQLPITEGELEMLSMARKA